MSYLGQAALKNSELKLFNVTSSTSATHTLSWTAANEQSLFITINGVKQQEDAYSIAGSPTVITLSSALVATDKMEVVGVLDIGEITVVGDNSVSTAKIAPNAVTFAELADQTQGDILAYGASGAPGRLAIGTAGQALVVNTGATAVEWGDGGGATGGGTDKIFYNNGQTVTTAYTVPSGENAMSAGPVSVNTGINITLTGTSEWVIV
tara:strand:+ start:94 stop:717 length:624 start_codon:yes stop_codon:yes gene_type:complete